MSATTANGVLETTLEYARAYRGAGLSVIPVARDGSKRPIVRWKDYAHRPPTEQEIESFFNRDEPPGIAIIGGEVSGGLEVLDFDEEASRVFARWSELVEAENEELLSKLTITATPRPGIHVAYRCAEIGGNQKLAMRPVVNKETGKVEDVVLIETRAEGGFVIAPGSPPECHASGKTYRHYAGPRYDELHTLNTDERRLLLRCARSLDESPMEEEKPKTIPNGQSLKPGDDFNFRGDWSAILTGWEIARQDSGKTYWRRPGKDGNGWSATTGHCRSESGGHELLAVFSQNADPFPGPGNGKTCSTHSKFDAYTRIHHGSDYTAAAKELARQGYGEQRQQAKSNGPTSGTKSDAPSTERFTLIPSGQFVRTDYRMEWIVSRIFVRHLPGVVGAPKKSMKTSIMVDLGVSLATAEPFLGEFRVYRKNRVALFSGESGEATLQETLLRVAKSKEIDPEQALENLLLGFDLPRFAIDLDMADFQKALAANGVEVVIVDPSYLCVLDGAGPKGPQASNAFQMGPLYRNFTSACLSAGATPLLVTHFRITRANAYAEPEIDDLSYAGIQEWARQWLLLSRRERYVPGTGQHRLWLSAGGSSGQSGLWSLDIDEGVINEDFTGRFWSVTVNTATEQRAVEKSQADKKREAKVNQQDAADETAIMGTVDRLAKETSQAILGYTQTRTLAGVPKGGRFERAIDRLKKQGILQETTYLYASGPNGKSQRQARGLQRVAEKEAEQVTVQEQNDGQTVILDGQTAIEGMTVRPDPLIGSGTETAIHSGSVTATANPE